MMESSVNGGIEKDAMIELGFLSRFPRNSGINKQLTRCSLEISTPFSSIFFTVDFACQTVNDNDRRETMLLQPVFHCSGFRDVGF